MNNTFRHITGYTLGGTCFLLLIPLGLYRLSEAEISRTGHHLFTSGFLRHGFTLLFFIPGLVFAAWSNIYLNMVGKGGPVDAFNIAISPRSGVLLTSGPYRYTRNPMVFGAVCLYTSFSVWLNSPACLLAVAGFLLLLTVYVKIFEEPRLLRDFGKEYEEYRKRVSMIFPFFLRGRKN